MYTYHSKWYVPKLGKAPFAVVPRRLCTTSGKKRFNWWVLPHLLIFHSYIQDYCVRECWKPTCHEIHLFLLACLSVCGQSMSPYQRQVALAPLRGGARASCHARTSKPLEQSHRKEQQFLKDIKNILFLKKSRLPVFRLNWNLSKLQTFQQPVWRSPSHASRNMSQYVMRHAQILIRFQHLSTSLS